MRLRTLLGRFGADVLIVLLAAAAQVEVWVDPTQTPRLVTAPAALLWTLPLLARRRSPLGAPIAVFAALTTVAFLAGDAVVESQVNGMAILAAFGIAGAHPDFRSALTGGAVGYAAMAAVILSDRPSVGGTIPILGFGAVAWGVGRSVGERLRRAADHEARADRLERAHRTAVADERARIARELHDVIAHSVSVMTVQAGGARLLLDEDPERARESLLAVEETGRQALDEMRRLLGILREDEQHDGLAPQPGIAEVESLIEHVRAAGLPVDVVVEGERLPLPPGIDLAAYRVVQEALTNALKHAGAARAEVSIRYAPRALAVAVSNDGGVAANGRGGHGLVGMRERVALYGGELEAGPRPGGGFAIRATIPLDAPSR